MKVKNSIYFSHLFGLIKPFSFETELFPRFSGLLVFFILINLIFNKIYHKLNIFLDLLKSTISPINETVK